MPADAATQMSSVAPPLVVVFNVGAGHGQADAVLATLQSGCAEAGRPALLLMLDIWNGNGSFAP